MKRIFQFSLKPLLLNVLIGLLVNSSGCKKKDLQEPLQQSVTRYSLQDITGQLVEIPDNLRVVSVGGTITEIIYALHEEDHLVGIDTSSTFPPETRRFPNVGYQRQLSSEGVLSLSPTLVLLTEDAGPEHVVAQLKSAGAKIFTLPSQPTIESAQQRIRLLGAIFHKERLAEELISQINLKIELTNKKMIENSDRPRVLFIYARGGGTLNIAGRNTAGAAMIELAGGQNAFSSFERYQPLTAESVVKANPEVIVLTTLGLESIGGIDGLLGQPGINQTFAGQNRRVVTMDDLKLLGFGPRLGDSILELMNLLHE